MSESIESPIESSSHRSIVLLTWLNPVIKLGSLQPLEDHDIPKVPKVHSSQYTYELFMKHWNEEVRLSFKSNRPPSISRVSVAAFGRNFYLSIIQFSLFLVATFLQPTFVAKILQYVQNGDAALGYLQSGIAFAVILGTLSVFQTVVFNLGFYYMQCFGLQIRPALIASLFAKSLRISNSARAGSSTGAILTLMSVDVERIWLATLLGNWLWMSPLMLAIAILELYLEVGYASLIVGLVLILWGYFQEVVSGWVNTTRSSLVHCTSKRTMLTNEVLQGIRVVKLYAWEKPSQDRINDVRKEEMVLLVKYSLLRMMNTVCRYNRTRDTYI